MIKLKNNKFLDKAKLYQLIDLLRNHINLPQNYLPLNAVSLADKVCKNLVIEQIDFKTPSICGILYVGEKTTSIALNAKRSATMQNFDCCHELIHYFCHNIKQCQCVCAEDASETKSITQNSFIEWQANEGAAELLVPYRSFIPTYVKLSREYARSVTKTPPENELAKLYNVTAGVIHNRIESLNYEIYQYLQHGKLNEIELLSQTKQKQLGWNKRHEKLYCVKCLSPIDANHDFCEICGRKLEKQGLKCFGYMLKGAGYMIYDGIKLNLNGQALECPNCKSETTIKDSEYCITCGNPIINFCSNYGCSHERVPLPGNARYCPYCGQVTTFFNYDYLKEWDHILF